MQKTKGGKLPDAGGNTNEDGRSNPGGRIRDNYSRNRRQHEGSGACGHCAYYGKQGLQEETRACGESGDRRNGRKPGYLDQRNGGRG